MSNESSGGRSCSMICTLSLAARRVAGGQGRKEEVEWITSERPKIDRVACPWLVRRFIDKEAEFLFVSPSDVRKVAEQTGAIPYDVEGVELSHDGPLCS